MKKIILIVAISSLIFVLGLLSGNLISFTQLDVAVLSASQDVGLKSLGSDWPMDAVDVSNSGLSEASLISEFDSFVRQANLQQSEDAEYDSNLQLVTSSDSIAVPADSETRELIESMFPDLTEDTLAGWVDTYSGMPLNELSGLLQQKQLMPSIVPESSIFAENMPRLAVEVLPPSTGLEDAIGRCQQNLKHAHTAGYRRQQTFTFVSDSEPNADAIRYDFSFNFKPGPIRSSPNRLHVAIEGDGQTMFLLNPGNVLTRSGMFARQADGCLGITYGASILRVEGTTDLPLDASQISISADGSVTYKDLEHEVQNAGTIKLVTVADLSVLESANGVHFNCPNGVDSVVRANDRTVLVPESLEASNVNRDQEWKTLEHFTKLGQLQQ